MANIAALWASMGSNIVAARSSMELFINPTDNGAMHLIQSALVSLLSLSSNGMPIKDGLMVSRFKIESPHKTDESVFLLQPQHE